MRPRRHGDRAGYYQHLRSHTVPCEPCRQAHRTYMRNYMRQHKKRTTR